MQSNNERTNEEIIESVIKNIKTIYDPEIPVNIFDLGFIYNVELDLIEKYLHCTVTMTLTSPGCSVADSIVNDVHYYTLGVAEIDEVHVNVVFTPPWNISYVSKEAKEILELDGTIFPQF